MKDRSMEIIQEKLDEKIWDYMKKEYPAEVSSRLDINNPITFKDLIFELISGKNMYEIDGLKGLDSEPEEIIIMELNYRLGEEEYFFGRFDFENSKEKFMKTDYYKQLSPEEKLRFEVDEN